MSKFISNEFKSIPDFSFGTDYSSIYPDYIDFGVGDPDLRTDKIIIDALYQGALNGATHYDTPQGNIGLRKAICKFYQEEYDFALEPEEVVITISGCQAMYTVAKTICNPGDEIIIPSPYFSPYTHQIQLAGGTPVYLETKSEEDFVVNVEELRKMVNPKTKAIIINTPNNPTGACIPKETLKNIYELAVEKDIVVICDDIYTLFT
ncbi:MAG: aminotransferase class I/II-fold pyridoxal phosphate-dependent enzyme, partial [Tissierellia bacterium]|nr:aminotransferase class I/II-fold pyridoxal phosphate-dependent enzyme [Tissierellia bacterium]